MINVPVVVGSMHDLGQQYSTVKSEHFLLELEIKSQEHVQCKFIFWPTLKHLSRRIAP
jgi:hypothetical protein